MSDYMKLTSDALTVADTETAAQILDEYVPDAMLTLELDNDTIYLHGDWVFAVQHESNVNDNVIGIEAPGDNIDFLADLAHIADPESLPFTLTEVCQGLLDQHPGLTRYKVTRDSIEMTYGNGNTNY